ncbi:MAG: hypothetical protein V1696_00660 [Candidatus Jorgensenbacteria bacterium]
MAKFIFAIFVIALVVYVVYYVVTSTDVLKFPLFPAYLSPVAPVTRQPAPPSTPSTSAATPQISSTPSPPPPPTPSPVPARILPTPPQGFTQADLSPFYGKVSLSSVALPSYYSGGGQFAIRADSSLSGPVDVGGWRLKGNRSEVRIEAASPSMTVGPVNQSALTLRPGEELIAYGATSNYVAQIRNVRLNKCTGYLNETYKLSPRIPEQCPRPDRSQYMTFSGGCQSYLYSLGACDTPTPAKMNELSYDSACRAFLDVLNYGSCERRYRSDADFLQSGWRAWLINSLPFDVNHDRLLLFDREGLVVDEYVY